MKRRFNFYCTWDKKTYLNVTVDYSKRWYGIKDPYKVIELIRTTPATRCKIYVKFYNFWGWQLDYEADLAFEDNDIKNIQEGKDLPLYIQLLEEIK